MDDAIDTNAEIAEAILDIGLQAFDIPASPPKDSPLNWYNTAKPSDIAKAHSTIRQFYRDWSAEGAVERELITTTVLTDLSTHSSGTNVLLPGAGLARLVLDLTLHGYNATGNEISYHQLLASNWVLNHTAHAGQFALHPFATTFTNLRNRTQQLTSVRIPDIHPASAIAERIRNGHNVGEMNMHAGDFVETYTSPEQRGAFDAVVSVFFIDTAANLIKYVEAVRNCLVDGGIWINIGPLLWHFDEKSVKGADEDRHRKGEVEMNDKGVADAGSFELTDDEVVVLLGSMGFEVLKHEMLEGGRGLGYIQDPQSMLQNLYQCSNWFVRRMPAGNEV